MSESVFCEFDSELVDLINDLNLVLAISPAGVEFWSRWLASRYRVRFCDRYNQYLEMRQRDNARLLRDLARRNAKYSRFTYEPSDFPLQTTLDFSD